MVDDDEEEDGRHHLFLKAIGIWPT